MPGIGELTYTNYVGVAGVGTDAATLPADDPRAGMFGYDRRVRLEQVKDGAANTALFLETTHDVGPWLRGGPATVRGVDPADVPLAGEGRAFGGTHPMNELSWRWRPPTASLVVMADGSVRFLADVAAPAILPVLATIAGGESIPDDW